ncbi:MAG: response regulator [Terriglobales bacterium]
MQRFLVVDDDTIMLHLTAVMLSAVAVVDTADNTAKALRQLVDQEYDLLLTDLNIDSPGDGLTLAGANRSLHPQSRNILITGYPDFTSALAAVQNSFNEVILKPVDLETLRRLGQGNIERRPAVSGKIAIRELIARGQATVVAEWLRLVENDPDLSRVRMTSAQRLDHVTVLVAALGRRELNPAEEKNAAEVHGRERRRLGYRPEWVSLEISYLRQVVLQMLLRELLRLDLSVFPQAIFQLNARLDADLIASLRAFGLASN